MNIINNSQHWPDNAIIHWVNKIELTPGASLEKIIETENAVGFEFPDSFKTLYMKVNGFGNNDWNENMISIWPLDRILKEYGRYDNFVGFSDYLINSHVYGFLKGQQGIFKNYDLAESVPEKIAETFEEAITLININSDLLY
jgi:hypothetical protein